MTFNPVSPGVFINEIDLTPQVPALATTVGAIAGIFSWGPLFSPTLVSSEAQLLQLFGPPSNLNAETWFSAANFLAYGQNLWVVRTASTNLIVNSTVNTYPNCAVSAVGNTVTLSYVNLQETTTSTYNSTVFKNQQESSGWSYDANTIYVAKYPGALGNSLRVGQCDAPGQYRGQISLSGTIVGNVASAGNSYVGNMNIYPGANAAIITFTATNGSNVASGNLFANTLISTSFGRGDLFRVPTNVRSNPYQFLQVTNYGGAVTNSTVTTVRVTFNNHYSGGANCNVSTVDRWWEYYKFAQPANGSWISSHQANSSNPTQPDIVSVVVIDQNGNFTGTPNTVLEVYANLSRATDAVNADGSSNYYQTVINGQSPYIWVVNDRPNAPSNTAANLVGGLGIITPFDTTMVYGNDGDSETVAPLSTLINGWTYFVGKENISINLVIAGKSVGNSGPGDGVVAGVTNTTYYNTSMVNWLINNIAEGRKDCVVFFSPDKSLVVNNQNGGDIPSDLVNWAGILNSSTRAFMDCNYKYQYDKYNNINRWVPLNGDIAGLCVYTDTVAYPWFSIAGYNRGQIKNAIKLAWNPQQADRDFIYPNAINPVVTFPGQGTYLYGDSTFTTQDTAFNRINVRRLFLYMEIAIALTAKYTLFEINDVFTQNQFKNQVNPFLKNIQGARGITDYLVVCDGTNNTAQVIDGDQFLAAIYVKPARSINYIKIDFVATPDGVSFSSIEQPSY
jgi:hypothetical protein